MKPSLPFRITALGLAGAVAVLSGCTHRLEIKNLNDYRANAVSPLAKRISIGIIASEEDPYTKRLAQEVATELKKYAGEVVEPYMAASDKKVDVVADLRFLPEYRGSGANFFINFPGFLIFTPAWHGYNYHVTYKANVTLIDGAKNDKFDQFSTPIDLDVRHAAMNRTWTELSWLEVGAIALVGGAVFTGYDPHVTPLAVDAAGETIGEYVGSEIIAHINSSGRFAALFEGAGNARAG